MNGRWPYLVSCPSETEAQLVVISDSPEGAASFMRLRIHARLADWGIDTSTVAPMTYSVHPMAEDVGDGVWLSGYDGSDDLEDLLRTAPRSYVPNDIPLWGPEVKVTL